MEQPREGPADEGISLTEVKGAIEFRCVTFRYPQASQPTLRNVSFAIQPGERVAILGRVGSGKSTLLRLALGLYPPEDGLVMLDGIDLRQFDRSFRDHVGAALQESVLLTGSVRQNITLDREDLSDEALLRAAEISGTHAFMSRTTNGYDLTLADRGEGLSGGQRQSIAIARALIARPQVLLLDEPTSAMDGQTEAMLIDRLVEEVAGRTLIVVTHRPQLLKLVERIIVMEAGAVIMDGPRDAVLAQLNKPREAA